MRVTNRVGVIPTNNLGWFHEYHRHGTKTILVRHRRDEVQEYDENEKRWKPSTLRPLKKGISQRR